MRKRMIPGDTTKPGNKYNFILPLYVTIPHTRVDDKKHSLSFNHFTELNHFTRRRIKELFEPIHAEVWEGYADKIRVHYQIERPTRAKFDTGNFLYILDKMFLDWLQAQHLIRDDNFAVVEMGRGVGYNQCKKPRARVIVEILAPDTLQIKP